MPLQWLPLQERQPQKSPVSEALRPQGRGVTTHDFSFLDREAALQEADAQRKFQEKMMKMQHEQEMEKTKFTTGMQGDAQKQQTTMGNVAAQAQQQGAQRQQIEDNPEPAAKEMYELLKTLPDEAKQQLLQQIFTPTAPKGTMTSAGRTVTMPEKYNPIAGVFMSKGWATVDASGRPVLSEPERIFEKGTFEIVEKGGIIYKHNTATGDEEKLGSIAEPEGTVDEIVKQIREDAVEIVKASDNKVSLEDAIHDAALDYGLNEDTATELAKFKGMPKGEKGKGLYKTFIDWVKSRGAKEATKEDWEKAAGKVAGAFKEDNVSALVPIISDDVTPAERAYLKGQGASDSDIDEAIKRKGSK